MYAIATLISRKLKLLHLKFLGGLIKAAIIIYGIYLLTYSMEPFRKFTSTIAIGSSLLVVVLGFAAQESLSNVINGMMISMFKPFEVGDRIKLLDSDIAGFVEDITLRHVVIKTFNNSRVIVPNSVINKEKIENSHYKDTRAGMFIDIPITFDSDVEKAIEIVNKVVESHPLYLDVRTDEEINNGTPLVITVVRDINPDGVWIRSSVWTRNINDNFQACSDIRKEIVKQFKENGIQINVRSMTNNREVIKYEEYAQK